MLKIVKPFHRPDLVLFDFSRVIFGSELQFGIGWCLWWRFGRVYGGAEYAKYSETNKFNNFIFSSWLWAQLFHCANCLTVGT